MDDKNIGRHSGRIRKFKLFINQYQWKEIYFLRKPRDCKKIETDKKIIYLNVLFSLNNSNYVRQAYIPKHNSKRKNKTIV